MDSGECGASITPHRPGRGRRRHPKKAFNGRTYGTPFQQPKTQTSINVLLQQVRAQGIGKHSEGQAQACPFLLVEGQRVAHLETIRTGLTVTTFVRGRVYRQQQGQRREQRPRPAQSLQARMSLKAKQRRRVCLLSARDARWLEEYGVGQPCHGPGCTHAHHTRARINALVASGDLRWIGDSENVAAWPDARIWKGVPSGGPMGPKVMQLVPVG